MHVIHSAEGEIRCDVETLKGICIVIEHDRNTNVLSLIQTSTILLINDIKYVQSNDMLTCQTQVILTVH